MQKNHSEGKWIQHLIFNTIPGSQMGLQTTK
jgi:hypothetical protein